MLLCVTEYPTFSGPSENVFVPIHLLEHRYRGGLTTLKTRYVFVRRKPLSIEVQGNLCGREAVSYKCRKRLFGKFYAEGFALNLTIPWYQTVGLGELELQMKSG
jgi:hypothetical protein